MLTDDNETGDWVHKIVKLKNVKGYTLSDIESQVTNHSSLHKQNKSVNPYSSYIYSQLFT